MKVNSHRYCDFDADRNCIFFFGADDNEEESSQWVAANELISSESNTNHHPQYQSQSQSQSPSRDRHIPYINVFAKQKQFKMKETKCKLVHVNGTELKVTAETPEKESISSNNSNTALPPLPLAPPGLPSAVSSSSKLSPKSPVTPPAQTNYNNIPAQPQQKQHPVHCVQFPAYSVNPPQTHPDPRLLQQQQAAAQARAHAQARATAQVKAQQIMAKYAQKGQQLAQKRAEVEAEIVQRIQCIKELETRLNKESQQPKVAVTTGSPYYYTTTQRQTIPTSGLRRSISTPLRAKPVVRLPQEFMVNTAGNLQPHQQPQYTVMGGQQILIGMRNDSQKYQQQQQHAQRIANPYINVPSTHSTVTVNVDTTPTGYQTNLSSIRSGLNRSHSLSTYHI